MVRGCGQKLILVFRTIEDLGNLTVHISTVHEEKKHLKCELCEFKSSYKNVMKQHLSIHSSEKHFQCDICDKGFSNKGHLKVLKMSVHDINKPGMHAGMYLQGRPAVAPKFSDTITLSPAREGRFCQPLHRSWLRPCKPYKCGICEVNFSLESYLKRHILKNHEEKNMQLNLLQ